MDTNTRTVRKTRRFKGLVQLILVSFCLLTAFVVHEWIYGILYPTGKAKCLKIYSLRAENGGLTSKLVLKMINEC